MRITDLHERLSELSPTEQHRFQRLYDVTVDEGRLEVPKDMKDWVADTFGTVRSVERQSIVRVTNRVTDEAALFNGLRADRPIDASSSVDLDEVIDEHRGGPFSEPETGTPEDTFGRVRGDHGVSASNIAKYDARHGLVIADEVDPLSFDAEELRDRFDVADAWIDRASDDAHRYPFLMWNCLWKSGASIVHGHMQVLVAKDKPYRRIDTLERAAAAYEDSFDADLYEDIVDAHRDAGLTLGFDGVDGFVHLTPRKEKEVVVVADEVSASFVDALHDVLRVLIDETGTRSFNAAVYYPPRSDESWSLPVIGRVVDRGDLGEKTTDMGGMEVYGGENVVASDPYKVKRAFEKA